MDDYYTTIDCGYFEPTVIKQDGKLLNIGSKLQVTKADVTVISKYDAVADIGDKIADLDDKHRELLVEYLGKRKDVTIRFLES